MQKISTMSREEYLDHIRYFYEGFFLFLTDEQLSVFSVHYDIIKKLLDKYDEYFWENDFTKEKQKELLNNLEQVKLQIDLIFDENIDNKKEEEKQDDSI